MRYFFLRRPYEKKESWSKTSSFPPELVLRDDTLSVYYGGADTVCCVATCSLKSSY